MRLIMTQIIGGISLLFYRNLKSHVDFFRLDNLLLLMNLGGEMFLTFFLQRLNYLVYKYLSSEMPQVYKIRVY